VGDTVEDMPRRSTPRQRLVAILRENWAKPGVVVTESKMLRDAVLGIDCEVDVVVEGVFEDQPTTVSFEVVDGRGLPRSDGLEIRSANTSVFRRTSSRSCPGRVSARTPST
jgi:hypothetical protein